MLMSPLLVAMLATASNSVSLGASPAGMRTGNPAGGPPAQPVPAASALQKKFIGWDMTAFIHFSITTYTGSQNGNQDPTKFAPPPATLNVSQWVATVKAMGAKVAVLTSKHEAGFCLWPTKTSSVNYSIAMSPTVGKRDLIREFTDACKAQGMLAGLYFTPPDPYTVEVLKHPQGSPAHTAVQLAQMEELTTNYGELSYIWFDHYGLRTSNKDLTCVLSGGKCPARCTKNGGVCGYPEPLNQTYAKLAQIVRKNQPGAVILGQDTKQTGGESGYAPYPLWYYCDTRMWEYSRDWANATALAPLDNCIRNQTVSVAGAPYGHFFKGPESDCSIYNGCHPWFASDSAPVQSLDALMLHYELTVGRGAEFILNVPPSAKGIIGPREAAAAAALGKEVARRYPGGHCMPSPADPHTAAAQFTVVPGGSKAVGVKKTFSRVWLGEGVYTDGQRVTSYRLEAGTYCVPGTLPRCKSWTFLNSSLNSMHVRLFGLRPPARLLRLPFCAP
jgi:alpha-L-fucosidase